jgi:undecaprenyl-diphosphatase
VRERFLLRSVLIVAATFGVVVGIGAVVQVDVLNDFDTSLYARFDDNRWYAVSRAMRTITHLGEFQVSYGALLAAGAILGAQRSSWRLAVAPVIFGFLQHSLSAVSARILDSPIPDGPLVLGNPGNYPSGGVARAVLWVGVVVMYISLDRPAARRWIAPVCALAGVIEIVSRYYLGLHFPFDVVGGFLLGAGLTWGFVVLVGGWETTGRIEPPPLLGSDAAPEPVQHEADPIR